MSRYPVAAVALALASLAASPAFAQMEPESVQLGETPTGAPAELLPSRVLWVPAISPVDLDRPFARILPNFGRDLVRFVSIDTALVLGVGSALGAVAYKHDEHLTAHASAGGTDQVFAVGGTLGGGYVQIGIAMGTYAIGRATRHPATAHLGSDLIRAQVLTGVLTHSVKAIARRSRPNEVEVRRTGTFSFPSAHSSATWTSATVVWRHLGWKAGVPASLVAAYASASRLQQNQHFMSDVLVGAAIGIAVGRTVTAGHAERRWALAPERVPGGVALGFVFTSR